MKYFFLKIFYLTVALLILYSSASFSQSLSAATLYSYCDSKPNSQMSYEKYLERAMHYTFCLAWINGLIDGYEYTRGFHQKSCKCDSDCFSNGIACLPREGIQIGKVVERFMELYKTDPSYKDDTARSAILFTIGEIYPCGKASVKNSQDIVPHAQGSAQTILKSRRVNAG